MSRLKKFDQYMKEQDQHRMESEKDIIINSEIKDIHSDEITTTSNIKSEDISPNDIDSLRNANDVHENKVNEGSVKNLKLEITEILEDLIERIQDAEYQGEIDEFVDRIFSLMSNSITESNEFDLSKPVFKYCINIGGLSTKRAVEEVNKIREMYANKNYNIFIVPTMEGKNDVECIWNPQNESLDKREDIPQIILDQEEARRFKETKDTLDGKSKEVYDTTFDVEKNLEKEDNMETQHPYEGSEESPNGVDINDFTIVEDFTVYPDGEDFKLIKKSLGEETNYSVLRNFLKENFPGWEKHTTDILDAWTLIK